VCLSVREEIESANPGVGMLSARPTAVQNYWKNGLKDFSSNPTFSNLKASDGCGSTHTHACKHKCIFDHDSQTDSSFQGIRQSRSVLFIYISLLCPSLLIKLFQINYCIRLAFLETRTKTTLFFLRIPHVVARGNQET
jgi:hypothetical protein